MTRTSSSVVVVLAAGGAVPAAVRDVLRDWVSLGIVQPLVWLEADELAPGATLAQVVGTHLLADDAPRTRLQDHLANRRRLDVLRLVGISAVGDRTALVPHDIAGDLSTALEAVAPNRVVPLHVVLTRQGAGGWREDVVVPGWQTLVLAPEDSWSPSPDTPPTEFAVGGDESEYVAHAAAGVASIAGLWTGVAAGPFDHRPRSTDDAVVVRAFLRRLDASSVASRLRRALTDLTGGLPLPQSSSGRVGALQDPEHGASQVVERLVRRHAALFEVRTEEVSRPRQEILGAWSALKMFFTFLASALRAAPGALVVHVQGRGGALVARRVQQALFGEGGRYEVVAAGVNAAGLPAGTADLADAAVDVRDRLAHVVPSEGTVPDLSGFWGDVVAGALSLADGGDHGSEVGPVVVGGQARVVRDTAAIAPAPEDALPLPASVTARLGRSSIDPYDVRQHTAAAQELAQSSGELSGGDVERWRQRTGSSYTGLLGHRLAGEVDRRHQQLGQLLAVLQADQGSVDQGAVDRGLQHGRSILLRALLGVVVILVLAVAVARLDLLRGRDLLLVAAVVLLVWLGTQAMALVAEQRRVFTLLHAQQRAEDALEVASRNVPVVAAALHLSTTMYAQYLGWAPVLGRFLREPFGPGAEPAAPARLHGLLPRAVGFGVAETDDDRLAAVAHELGGTVFDRGWLQPLWEAFLADAPRQLGSAGLALRDDPGLLLADDGAVDGRLRRWSGAVVEQGVTQGAGDALWQRARQALLSRGTARLSDELFTRVEVQAQEQHEVTALSGREFFATLTDALVDVERHFFSPDLFAPLSRNRDSHVVARTTALGHIEVSELGATRLSQRVTWMEPDVADVDGLDQFLVVVQTTAALPPEDLVLRGVHVPSRSTPVASEPDDHFV